MIEMVAFLVRQLKKIINSICIIQQFNIQKKIQNIFMFNIVMMICFINAKLQKTSDISARRSLFLYIFKFHGI